jgi:hypothetical protein
VPVLYHDASADAAYVFLPDSLSVPREEQEKAIGRLTNRVLESLPAEERRMYLLQPQTFIVEQTFVDAILEASGVSRADLDRARERGRLVERMLQAGSPEELDSLVADRDEGSDYELLLLVGALIDDAEAAGDDARAEGLRDLRETLAARFGELRLGIDEVLPELVKAHAAGTLDDLVAPLRSLLDYGFFTQLTERIDAADGAQREELTALRAALLEAIDRLDASTKAEVEAAVELLKWVLQSRHPRPALESRLEELSPAFFLVLSANLQAAEESADPAVVERLHAIQSAAVELVEGSMAPLDRLVNRLARATDAESRREALAAAEEPITADVVAALRATASRAAAGGAAEIAANLEAAADEVDQQLRVEAQP